MPRLLRNLVPQQCFIGQGGCPTRRDAPGDGFRTQASRYLCPPRLHHVFIELGKATDQVIQGPALMLAQYRKSIERLARRLIEYCIIPSERQMGSWQTASFGS